GGRSIVVRVRVRPAPRSAGANETAGAAYMGLHVPAANSPKIESAHAKGPGGQPHFTQAPFKQAVFMPSLADPGFAGLCHGRGRPSCSSETALPRMCISAIAESKCSQAQAFVAGRRAVAFRRRAITDGRTAAESASA